MADLSYYTPEGFEKLKQELHDLKTRERTAVAAAISEAREKGDLKENAEYDAAKEEQGKLEARISKMETLLANARVLDYSTVDNSKVFILSTVRVMNHKMKKEMSFTLVAGQEANVKEGKISVDSPIGTALLGHSVGDKVKAQVPAGEMELEILEITR